MATRLARNFLIVTLLYAAYLLIFHVLQAPYFLKSEYSLTEFLSFSVPVASLWLMSKKTQHSKTVFWYRLVLVFFITGEADLLPGNIWAKMLVAGFLTFCFAKIIYQEIKHKTNLAGWIFTSYFLLFLGTAADLVLDYGLTETYFLKWYLEELPEWFSILIFCLAYIEKIVKPSQKNIIWATSLAVLLGVFNAYFSYSVFTEITFFYQKVWKGCFIIFWLGWAFLLHSKSVKK